MKHAGLANENIKRQINQTKWELKSNKQQLNRLLNDAERQRKRRIKRKQLISDLSKDSHENANKLRRDNHQNPGRPPLHDSFPELHHAIVKIATAGAGADFGRRTDILNACLTLDDLRNTLLKDGYELSRQSLYLRLIPKRKDSVERKRHVTTVPVKLRKVRNNQRKKHNDADFTFAMKKYLKNIASLFGPDQVFVLSIDDKAKVPIGITAATKQAPMVMHMTYEIRLPGHDFVVATSHKLTPSVYAGCELKK